ncbi:MAG: DUF29 domain-containing protein, partial [Sphaerospermopsis kisseleviana]
MQAVKQAKAQTGLPRESFPVIRPYHLQQVIIDDFLPD